MHLVRVGGLRRVGPLRGLRELGSPERSGQAFCSRLASASRSSTWGKSSATTSNASAALSTSSTSSTSSTPTVPPESDADSDADSAPVSAPTLATDKSWGRLAATLQSDLDSTQEAYLGEHKRAMDPVSSLLGVQQEVQEEMAAALGRTGTTLTIAAKNTEALHAEFLECEERFLAADVADEELKAELLRRVRAFNEARQEADAARLDLIVHRQAVGFSFNNYKHVHKVFELPDAITRHDFSHRYYPLS